VLDANAAADADVWMAYALLEAGRAWNDQRYTSIGRSLAKRIADEEVADIGGIGPVPHACHRKDFARTMRFG
jgi:endoglucanase